MVVYLRFCVAKRPFGVLATRLLQQQFGESRLAEPIVSDGDVGLRPGDYDGIMG